MTESATYASNSWPPSYASSVWFAGQLRVFCEQDAVGELSKKRLDTDFLVEFKEIMRLTYPVVSMELSCVSPDKYIEAINASRLRYPSVLPEP
jgi:hypothetical protein